MTRQDVEKRLKRVLSDCESCCLDDRDDRDRVLNAVTNEVMAIIHDMKFPVAVAIGKKTFQRCELGRLCRVYDIPVHDKRTLIVVHAGRGTLTARYALSLIAKQLHEAGNPDDGWLDDADWRRHARHARDKVYAAMKDGA